MKKIIILSCFLAFASLSVAQFSSTSPGGTGTQFLNANASVVGNFYLGQYLTFTSQNSVISWGAGGLGDLYFRTLGTASMTSTYTDRMLLTNNGRLSLGYCNTTQPLPLNDPSDQLHVKTNDASGITISQYGNTRCSVTLDNAVNSGKKYSLSSTNSYDSWGAGHFIIRDATAAQDRLFISGNNGAAGFGTSNPQAFLHIIPSSNTVPTPGFCVENNNTASAGTGQINKVKHNDTKAFVVQNAASSTFEAFKVYGDGRTKIGLSNADPTALLHVYTPDNTSLGFLIEHNGTATGASAQLTRVKNAATKAIVVQNAVSSPYDVFRVMGDGKVYATEVNVLLAANFPDYVFSKDYKLMNLNTLENYINKNHHLPNVPSAKEIEKDGANLGELSKIQMEKIEELTLYIIELKKEVDELKKNSIKNK